LIYSIPFYSILFIMSTISSDNLPPCRVFVRSKEGIEVFSIPSEPEQESSIVTQSGPRNFLLKGTTSFQALHPDGSAAFVHRPDVGIFKLGLDLEGQTTTTNTTTTATLDTSTPFFKETARVQIVDVSPQGTYLLTWERAKEGETPNLKVWSTATGDYIIGFRQKTLRKDAWPYLQWTNDEAFAFLLATNEVRVYPGTFPNQSETRFVDKLRIPEISSLSVPSQATGALKILFTSFSPKDKNKPSRAALYEYPTKTPSPAGANASYPALFSKSLFQAEEMSVYWSPKGDAALISLQTNVDTSGQSYYGSNFLYLMSPQQNDTIAVPLPQEGPVLDVAWMPNPTKPPCFAVAAGKMPSMTSLHDGTGKATFLFGNAHRNTIAWAPHGRFACLAGFGNLAGGMTFWDKNKLKMIPPSQGVTASCTVGYGWSPDSRLLVVSTTSPRMNVDNGVRVYRYNGEQVQKLPWDNKNYFPDRLLQASFLPALPSVYPDRPQSPTLKEGVATTPSGQEAPKPAGRYVPPSVRGKPAGRGGGSSLAERMNAEKESKMKGAQKVVEKPKVVMGAAGKVVVGLAPAAEQGKSKSALRREKTKQKKEEEDARKALEEKVAVEAAAASAESVDPEKRARKINKTLKQIEDLKQKDSATLNEDQQKKIDSEKELRDELAKLGV
jgi:translation initiation factor 2A